MNLGTRRQQEEEQETDDFDQRMEDAIKAAVIMNLGQEDKQEEQETYDFDQRLEDAIKAAVINEEAYLHFATDEFKTNHEGKFACFFNGELIDIYSSRETLDKDEKVKTARKRGSITFFEVATRIPNVRRSPWWYDLHEALL